MLLLKKVSDDTNTVNRSVVVLVDPSRFNCIERRLSNWPKNAISVAELVKAAFYTVQGGSRLKVDASPDMTDPSR